MIRERRISRRTNRHLRREHRSAAEIDVVRKEVAASLAEGDQSIIDAASTMMNSFSVGLLASLTVARRV